MRSCPKCRSPYSANVEFCGIDGHKLVESEQDPLLGQELERYRITGHIGDGAMARVYRAKHHVLDREYAVKVLFGEIASNKELAERFRREARAMSKMNHPNLVSVVDFGTTAEGLTFLTMELIRGRTLRSAIKREAPFSPERTAAITRQIALGLAEAHRNEFVHRDLKPSNVMLVPAGEAEHVKILDFGMVLASDGDSEQGYLTRTGQFLGTPLYMAPEQILCGDVQSQADLYALGVVVFEMLEGSPPFRAKKLVQIHKKHLTAAVPPMRPAKGLEDITRKLLAKKAEYRPRSALEVIEMIDRLGLTAKKSRADFHQSLLDKARVVTKDLLEGYPAESHSDPHGNGPESLDVPSDPGRFGDDVTLREEDLPVTVRVNPSLLEARAESRIPARWAESNGAASHASPVSEGRPSSRVQPSFNSRTASPQRNLAVVAFLLVAVMVIGVYVIRSVQTRASTLEPIRLHPSTQVAKQSETTAGEKLEAPPRTMWTRTTPVRPAMGPIPNSMETNLPESKRGGSDKTPSPAIPTVDPAVDLSPSPAREDEQVRKALDRISQNVARASFDLPPSKVMDLETRYFHLVRDSEERLSDDERSKLLQSAAVLLHDIDSARRSATGEPSQPR
jgi:serine/threonine protein kinase